METPQRPSEVNDHVGLFDRFAGWCSDFVSRAPFFFACCLLVTLWLVQGLVRVISTGWTGFTDSAYQLEINTTTTIITFLMVAILQNTQTRNDAATQKKDNAMADALAAVLDHLAEQTQDAEVCRRLRDDAQELRASVGLELRESTT